ncbi:MAG: class I SAM-dependent methyltransferase [Elusimicrobiota bacterium]
MKLPQKSNMRVTNSEDPIEYYYKPLTGFMYLKRLKMAEKVVKTVHCNNLLEIGYGSGIFLPELSVHCASLYGMDIHSNVKLVHEMLVKEGVNAQLSTGDILKMEYLTGQFDCVVCLSVMEHIEDTKTAVEEIHRILAEKGFLIVGIPTKNVITDGLFKILGFDHDKEHVSGHNKVIAELRKKFDLQLLVKFPVITPLDLSLYTVTKWVKK